MMCQVVIKGKAVPTLLHRVSIPWREVWSDVEEEGFEGDLDLTEIRSYLDYSKKHREDLYILVESLLPLMSDLTSPTDGAL